MGGGRVSIQQNASLGAALEAIMEGEHTFIVNNKQMGTTMVRDVMNDTWEIKCKHPETLALLDEAIANGKPVERLREHTVGIVKAGVYKVGADALSEILAEARTGATSGQSD
jgi:predicted PilT family ATPase